MKKNKFFYNLILIALSLAIVVILFSSILNIYNNKNNIKLFLKGESSDGRSLKNNEYSVDYNQVKLANDIVKNGEYILYFRHGHREKWIDVAMYDAMEAIEKLNADNLYFKNAVCLSEMGRTQVKMMGEFIKKINLPIGKIVTSPSCRARQTSMALFGDVGEINNLFMHPGPYNENLIEFRKKVKDEILNLKIFEGKNSIISAHNGVIKREIFDFVMKDIEYDLEEGGFYVMKKKDNQLILVDKFHNYNFFNQILFNRPE